MHLNSNIRLRTHRDSSMGIRRLEGRNWLSVCAPLLNSGALVRSPAQALMRSCSHPCNIVPPHQYRPHFQNTPSDTWYCSLHHPQSSSHSPNQCRLPKINTPTTSQHSQLAPPRFALVQSGCVILQRDHALPALIPTVHRCISGLNTLLERVLDLNHWFAHVKKTDGYGELRT